MLYWINPGDIKIRHHYTKEIFKLHSFRHKDYWAHGRGREKNSMMIFSQLIRSGELIIEIGGHIGYVSTFFAKLTGPAGKVVTFEPGPNNLPYLRENITYLTNIKLVEKAVADFVGTAVFHIENFSGQNNSLLDHHRILEANLRSAGISGIPTSIIEVQCTSLDAFLSEAGLSSPSFVKIDVEGAELSVLRGMNETLQHDDVALMVEVTDNQEIIYRLLEGYGFVLFNDEKVRIEDPLSMGGNIFCIKNNSPKANIFLGNNQNALIEDANS